MSCDHELVNEWARFSWKNASYITIDDTTQTVAVTLVTIEATVTDQRDPEKIETGRTKGLLNFLS